MICKNLKSYTCLFTFTICIGLLVVCAPLFSQNNAAPKNTAIQHKILLVPFEPTMFMDGIGKAVNAETHLSYKKIIEDFRYRLDLALHNAFKGIYPTTSILSQKIPSGQAADTTLPYIYSSIGYNYDLLSSADSSGESHAEFDPKLQKKHFIQNGQLQVPMDYSQRFMNVHIVNPRLLSYLNKKYGTDIFVFINEVDIKNVSNNATQDLSESNYKRWVTIQYSILNMQKHYLAKGILTTYFPYTENDPKIIGEKYFSLIASDMVKKLTEGLQKAEAGHSH